MEKFEKCWYHFFFKFSFINLDFSFLLYQIHWGFINIFLFFQRNKFLVGWFFE
jgi:hypothetical protein